MTEERPILFKSPMVKAVLDGAKTQTRRLMKPQPQPWGPHGGLQFLGYFASTEEGFKEGCPIFTPKFGRPGDHLWVREAWITVAEADNLPPRDVSPAHRVWYEADNSLSGLRGLAGQGRLRPSVVMPRWASRITLEITEVLVERLQDISSGDAISEDINSPDSWELNPWAWCINFKVIKP